MVTRHTEISGTGFSARMQAETVVGDVPGEEKMGYFAILRRDDGSSSMGTTGAVVNEKNYEVKWPKKVDGKPFFFA